MIHNQASLRSQADFCWFPAACFIGYRKPFVMMEVKDALIWRNDTLVVSLSAL